MTYTIAVIIISVIFYVSLKIEEKISETNQEETLTFGEVALLAIALVCQEGRYFHKMVLLICPP